MRDERQQPHDVTALWERLAMTDGGTIVFVILDGLGGVPDPAGRGTALEVARTPHLDWLAKHASCGLLEIVGPGISPGSGPGHLALFGYDPLRCTVGRGVLSALGIDFDLHTGDVAARANFATADRQGRITDRRAGRISSETGRSLCRRIREELRLEFDGTLFFEPVSEHRAVLILRGAGFSGDVEDTDPLRAGVPALDVRARSHAAEATAAVVRDFLAEARRIVSDEPQANAVLLRGFDRYERWPSLEERFGLKGLCIADYPMYRGVSRLLGLDVVEPPGGLRQRFERLREAYAAGQYDFFFLHVKHTDTYAEDRDFDGKVEAIETVDALLPQVAALEPDVLVVTGDHSTPALMGRHSWHPVPVLIHSRWARRDGMARFDETACQQGSLGLRPAVHLMGLALAHAGRLRRFGA